MADINRLTGEEIAAVLEVFGFVTVIQRGDLIKLQRLNEDGTRELFTMPCSNELDRGTIRAIFQQASRFVPEEDLRPYFYP